MAKDDYHVIAYKILAYLYTCLKEGRNPEKSLLANGGEYIGSIPETYYAFIWKTLVEEGYVNGNIFQKAWGNEIVVNNVEDARITVAGIEYVTDNSFMQKVKEALKEAKAIIPFV